MSCGNFYAPMFACKVEQAAAANFSAHLHRVSPTGPTTSPTQSPVEPLPESDSNHMFCGNDFIQAKTGCSLSNHCPNGQKDCKFDQGCWHGVRCDVRDFIPYEEGGRVGKPTHKEIAEAMGLSYPSDDVRVMNCTRGGDAW